MAEGLTDAERAILGHLNAAWEGWLALDRRHPSDLDEVRAAIHALQNMLAFRVAQRVNPGAWWQPPDPREVMAARRIRGILEGPIDEGDADPALKFLEELAGGNPPPADEGR